MEGLILLNCAREAGLAVAAEGDKLVIRGPRRAELLARLLIEHKPEVLAALAPVMPPPDLRVDGFDPVDGSRPGLVAPSFVDPEPSIGRSAPVEQRTRPSGLPMASCSTNGASRKVEGGRFGSALVAMNRSAVCRRYCSPTKTASTSTRSGNA